MLSADDIIDDILRREGGFIDHPADRGGPTNHGVTIKTLGHWLGRPATIEDVRALTVDEAREIYREDYLLAPRFHKIIDDAVRGLAVDCAVHHGATNAVQLVQLAARVFPDGRLGPKTEAAISAMDPRKLYARLCAQRVRFIGRIHRRDPTQHVFAEGWAERVAAFIDEAA